MEELFGHVQRSNSGYIGRTRLEVELPTRRQRGDLRMQGGRPWTKLESE